MIDREDLDNIKNILSIANNDPDVQLLHKVLTALKNDDNVAFLDAIYSDREENLNLTIILLKQVYQAIKDKNNVMFLNALYAIRDQHIDITLLKKVYHVIKDYPEKDRDLLDSFSNNQFASKTALLDAINDLNILDKDSTVAIWGSWYGSILIPMLTNKVKKIISIDLDNEPLQIAKNRLFDNYSNVDYICDDIFKSYKKSYIDVNLIINTSCEHMPPMSEWPWFGAGAIENDSDTSVYRTPKLSNNCYFAFQSNNMFGIEGHINCVNSLEEFEKQLPERAEVLYREEVEDTRGTRYMLVGKFMPL